MTHNQRIVRMMELLGRKAVCQARHVGWMQEKSNCSDEEAEALLSKRLHKDLIAFTPAMARELNPPPRKDRS